MGDIQLASAHVFLDEQLHSLDVACDQHGGIKEAKDGRPLQRMARALIETNQVTIDEAVEAKSETVRLHEGI
ncbi:hypothetical protein D3C73_1422410 [compost metagenome]